MAWYDEEEEEFQDPYGNFGVDPVDFSQFAGQTSSGNFDINTSPVDLYNMAELDNVEPPKFGFKAADDYEKYVRTEPQRGDFKNKWWQNLAGGLIGGFDAMERGVAAGRQTRQNYLDQPYNRARAEWGARAKQMAEQAEIENRKNNLERQRYQQSLQAAAARVNARRQAALADNSIKTGEANRRNIDQQMRLRPLRTATGESGMLRQYNVLNPNEQTDLFKTNADTPAARNERLGRTIQAGYNRAAIRDRNAQIRLDDSQKFQSEQNERYRRTAADLNVDRPDAEKSISERVRRAYQDEELDTLRSNNILSTSEQGGISIDMAKLDQVVGRLKAAMKAGQPPDPNDAEIYREWVQVYKPKYGSK